MADKAGEIYLMKSSYPNRAVRPLFSDLRKPEYMVLKRAVSFFPILILIKGEKE